MISLEYFAGFFDGEGCVEIYARKNKKSGPIDQTVLRVTLANTQKDVLILLQSQFGGRIFTQHAKKKWKIGYRLTWTCQDAVTLLETILPFLLIKRSHAEIALKYWELHKKPKAERCDLVHQPVPGMPNHYVWFVKQEVIKQEIAFREQIKLLNARGNPDYERGH